MQSHFLRAIFLRALASSACAALIILVAGCGGNAFRASSMSSTSTTVAPPPSAPAPAPASGGSTAPTVQFTGIQNLNNWQWCSKDLPSGAVCASGRGNAVSWIAQHQTAPALDGSSAQFYIGGSTPYSNALWWRSLGPNSKPTRFQYDLWFYVDKGPVVQALEFDVNQSFGGTRYVFGTECNVKGTHVWDVWDGTKNVWRPSSAACPEFKSKTWNHLVWNFERTPDHKVHYVDVNLNGNDMKVDMYLPSQPHYQGKDDVNVAFQMDGNYRQEPYNSWLDKVTLSGW